MPTKRFSNALLGLLGSAAMCAPAFAGGACGPNGCAVPVQVMPGPAPQFGPMTVRSTNPMGHLRSIEFQRAPNVSITRIHGMNPTAGLSDAPSGFTSGCHPTSTTYCRQDRGTPVQVQLNAPAPLPAPVYQAPAPQVVAIGGGYDASKFTPRVYGDPTFVPGIAHVPTSIVDRDPVRAQQVLDSGRTVPQPVLGRDTFGGTVPHPSMMRQAPRSVTLPGTYAPQARSVTLPGTYAPQPRSLPMPFAVPGQPGAPMLQPSGPFAGSYGSTVGADGTYWEKVSGPTAFGDTIATQVICKRKLPTQTVNPVVGVPVPVPVAPACAPVPHGLAQYESGHAPISRYGAPERGRWTR